MLLLLLRPVGVAVLLPARITQVHLALKTRVAVPSLRTRSTRTSLRMRRATITLG